MGRFAWSDWLALSGAAALVMLPAPLSWSAVGETGEPVLEAAAGPAHLGNNQADVELHFLPEDGPDSGHVRVVLTPETRPLTLFEARAAASQAFLKALDEKGLGDKLTRITVVVRLAPLGHPEPATAEHVTRFVHRGGREWSVLPEE